LEVYSKGASSTPLAQWLSDEQQRFQQFPEVQRWVSVANSSRYLLSTSTYSSRFSELRFTFHKVENF